jgi:hypothetical protein
MKSSNEKERKQIFKQNSIFSYPLSVKREGKPPDFFASVVRKKIY